MTPPRFDHPPSDPQHAEHGQFDHGQSVRQIAQDQVEHQQSEQQRFEHQQADPKSSSDRLSPRTRLNLLSWAIIFFLCALIAALFGFGSFAFGEPGVAKALFFVFLLLAMYAAIAGERLLR